MALLEITQESNKGVTKRINPAAIRMMIEGQQSKQYKEPESSAIREIVSNCLDAVAEKNKAIKILRGEAKVEEFYVKRDDEIALDSNFFEGYYSLDHLAEGEDIIEITHEYKSSGKDILRIKDRGVGIGFVRHPDTGKTRLEGILELGYSTKRNTNTELGKFGIGAKSPLAIGSESGFLMKTVHNGKRFIIRVFDFTYHSMIGRFNSNGEENPSVVFYEGTSDAQEMFYEVTEEKNGTEIIVETSPAQRSLFIKAAKSQLQYFSNVTFHLIRDNGKVEEEPLAVKKIYENSLFIIPETSNYAIPHIVLNGVNYGPVNYAALEIPSDVGVLALKVPPSDVEVDRSRENLIWNEKTRNNVKDFIDKVKSNIKKNALKALHKDNFAEWVEAVLNFRRDKFSLSTKTYGSEAISFLGKEAIAEELETHSSGTKFSTLFGAVQTVATSQSSVKFSGGRQTEEGKELGFHLNYENKFDSKDLLSLPVVVREYDEGSISAAEKFSCLLYLRDVLKNPAIDAFLIWTLPEDEDTCPFAVSMISANFKYMRFVKFEDASKAYKVAVGDTEKRILSEDERTREEKEEARRERARYLRATKTITYYNYSGAIYNRSGNMEEILRWVDGKKIVYGLVTTNPTEEKPDQSPLLRFCSKYFDTTNVVYLGCSPSSINNFPTQAGINVNQLFTQTVGSKIDVRMYSSLLLNFAYCEEIFDFIDTYKEFIEKLNNKEAPTLRDIFNKIEDVFYTAIWARRYFGSTKDSWKTGLAHSYTGHAVGVELAAFFTKMAAFARFCLENPHAKEHFIKGAYLSIMELPEDTPMEVLPSGVCGFDYSPLEEIKHFCSVMSPLKDHIKTLKKMGPSVLTSPLMGELYNHLGFKGIVTNNS